ncbi:unnamed protein product [Paramecium primaurelia]|uniref:Uncharacterized protein n=1 Tax=Paramecium primaurelia TaxID=5886 RepID=A0A8S1MCH6_PARPR|nr:unnamed protein product [Paramecium primaurelia]
MDCEFANYKLIPSLQNEQVKINDGEHLKFTESQINQKGEQALKVVDSKYEIFDLILLSGTQILSDLAIQQSLSHSYLHPIPVQANQ